jgi:hypothetical protein
MSDFRSIDTYLDKNVNSSLDELGRLCAIPSIAAQNVGLDECAELVSRMLQQRGFKTEIMPSGGAPVVYAERKGKSEKTLPFFSITITTCNRLSLSNCGRAPLSRQPAATARCTPAV